MTTPLERAVIDAAIAMCKSNVPERAAKFIDLSNAVAALIYAPPPPPPPLRLPSHRTEPCEDCIPGYGCDLNCGPSLSLPTPTVPAPKPRRGR